MVALVTRCDLTTNEDEIMNTPEPRHDEPGHPHPVGDPVEEDEDKRPDLPDDNEHQG
jgi:hypothetical protein